MNNLLLVVMHNPLRKLYYHSFQHKLWRVTLDREYVSDDREREEPADFPLHVWGNSVICANTAPKIRLSPQQHSNDLPSKRILRCNLFRYFFDNAAQFL